MGIPAGRARLNKSSRTDRPLRTTTLSCAHGCVPWPVVPQRQWLRAVLNDPEQGLYAAGTTISSIMFIFMVIIGYFMVKILTKDEVVE